MARPLHWRCVTMARRFERRPPLQLDEDLWVCDADGHERGLHIRLRTTVVRLADGGLWLYSPILFDDALADQVEALGPVRHIVAPSRAHDLFAADAHSRWPNATLWASPGLAAARPQLGATPLPEDEACWRGQLHSVRIDAVPRIDEVAFFHVASRTAIVCDLVLNVHEESNWLARQLYRAMGVWRRPGRTRYWTWKTKDPQAAQRAYERIVAWEPRRVIMAHGDVVDEDATTWLRRALDL